MIVLVGAQIAFYVQNPELVRHGLRHNEVGGRTMERVAIHIMYLVGRSYHEGRTPWSREQLARRLHLPTEIILDVLDRLRQRGLLLMVSGRIRRYIPAVDMGNIRVRDVVQAVRQNSLNAGDSDRHMKVIPQAEDVIQKLDQAIEMSLGNMTLRDLIEMGEPAELVTKTTLRAR
jgi:membrane protein